jgi:hypothetical protein
VKKRDVFQDMADKWPSAILSRQEASKFTGGAVSSKFCANADSLGQGPDGRFNIGRKVCYPVPGFCEWLRARSDLRNRG